MFLIPPSFQGGEVLTQYYTLKRQIITIPAC